MFKGQKKKRKNPVHPVKKRYKVSTWLRLGLGNIATVAIYKLAKRFGYYRHRLPVGPPLDGSFLSEIVAEPCTDATLCYFSYHDIEVTSPPDWFVNPWNGVRCSDSNKPWS